MREAPLVLLLVLALFAAGCASPGQVGAAEVLPPAPAKASHLLANATEPLGSLVAPTFTLVGAIAKGGPVYGAGEPAVVSSLAGTLFAAFPGCDKTEGPLLFVGASACQHGLVYRSVDAGASWERLNSDPGATLAKNAPPANNDADVAVDSAGVVYVSNLGDGIEVQRSRDGGDSWEYVGNPVPEDSRSVDRNWMAAAGPGHMVVNWMGGPKNEERQVGIATTFDGGDTWSNVTYVGERIGWEGSVQFAPDGRTAYIPYTEAGPNDAPLGLGESTFRLMVARTLDGGATWEPLDTGLTTRTGATSFHFSGVLMAPALDVTGDGTLVWAWSEEVPDAAGAGNTAARLRVSASKDQGVTWSEPLDVSDAPSAIMPWVTGGAGDRAAITFFANKLPGDPDRSGLWDVRVAVVDGLGGPDPALVESVIEEDVHQGGICSGGGSCLLTGSDRALLDYFEADVMPDGNLVVIYPADPAEGAKTIDIRIAVQSGGTPLLAGAATGETL